jgi:hypothetical protein
VRRTTRLPLLVDARSRVNRKLSTRRDRVERRGIERRGIERRGIERRGIERCSIEWCRVRRCSGGRPGFRTDGWRGIARERLVRGTL